ncbi:MAG: N-acetylmuramic acid 6-phosphate etherase [Oscillospiraceae bacterium]|nr:N-acetylmuramic acid 6-phosphate etherase [Oscillospiraceae bacterium]
MTTETRNPNTMNLDTMSVTEILTVMNREDEKVPLAIREVLPEITRCVSFTTEAIRSGGRIIYMGAGTSGRLGVLDAVECPPTFGVAPGTVIGLVAGGATAFDRPIEDAEDSPEEGRKDLSATGLKANDVVIGIAASGRTPYVLGGLALAKETGCHTAAIVCNANSPMAAAAELAIEVFPGPECVTGSTRLKAGTCQKLILNMISTATMVGCGKTYGNLMVDVDPCNAKLVVRARGIVMEATGCDLQTAEKAMAEAGGHAKTAITMILADCSAEEARARLEKAGGHVRKAIE